MKQGKYTKTLAKILVTAIFLMQDMRRNVLPKFIGPSIKPGTWNIPKHPGTFNNYNNYEKTTQN